MNTDQSHLPQTLWVTYLSMYIKWTKVSKGFPYCFTIIILLHKSNLYVVCKSINIPLQKPQFDNKGLYFSNIILFKVIEIDKHYTSLVLNSDRLYMM